MEKLKKEATAEKRQAAYSKSQLIKCKKYQTRRDILNVLLQAEKKYTISEVDRLIEDFLNKEVN